ncbi:hypothetical protein V492_06519 [Pseudogymnoascus sp. VKM F-4246]|nr:hypothetical protein V492_06519 [Pseudogymnoascus sp. VKM F-4246]
MRTFHLGKFGLAVLGCLAVVQGSPSGSLINPNANNNAKNLMALLMNNYGNHALSGQQDEQWATWVTQNVGKTPAITGFDLMDYSPSRVAFGSSSNTVDQAFNWAQKGGIVAFCWHWGSPSGAYNTADQPWYSNFYTAATSFDVAAAMNNPSGSDYALILRDIDAIATQLKRLQSAGVPVLWRPLHEAEGGWFWWGAKGYSNAGDHSNQASTFSKLKSVCGDSKIIALTECDVIPDWSSSAPWAYWLVWGGSFINDGISNSLSYLKATYTSSNVLTIDELGNWQSGDGDGDGTTTPPTGGESGSGSPLYGQCGGSGWTGPTTCASGTCTATNEWYSQCI